MKKPVLWDVDFAVPEGVCSRSSDPNGAGKSTLIKTILGLIKPVADAPWFWTRYRPQNRLIAYVPQRSSVDWDFPTNVLDVASWAVTVT